MHKKQIASERLDAKVRKDQPLERFATSVYGGEWNRFTLNNSVIPAWHPKNYHTYIHRSCILTDWPKINAS